VLELGREAGNDAGAPTFALLAVGDESADVPIEAHQLGVDGKDGSRLGRLDPLFHIRNQSGDINANNGLCWRRLLTRHSGSPPG